jgi:hypothetical protein
MAYDQDAFRMFTQSKGFVELFAIDAETRRQLDEDDEVLLLFCMRFLKQVFFGEKTIKIKEGAAEKRYEARKDAIMNKHQENIQKYHARDPSEGTEK